MQFLADIIGAPVDRPTIAETTARGAAWLAGMQVGVYPGMEGFAAQWASERRFEPQMARPDADALHDGWKDAVERTLTTRE